MPYAHFPTFGALLATMQAQPTITAHELRIKHGCSITHARNAMVFASVSSDAVLKLCAQGAVSESLVVDVAKVNPGGYELQLTEAWERISAAGRNKIRRKDLLDTADQRVVRRMAPDMLVSLGAVRRDPGFAGLSPEVQSAVDGVLGEVAVMREGKRRSAAMARDRSRRRNLG